MSTQRDALALPAWIVALLLLFALTAASTIVVPLVLAALLALTLAPAVRALIALRLPRALATMLVVAAALLVAGSVFYMLAEPAQNWIERAPAALRKLEFGLRGLLAPIEAASEATESLMNIGNDGEKPTVVATTTPSPALALLSRAPALLASLIATVFLTFLFLLHGDALLRKFVAIVPGLSAKKELVAGTREAQHELSRYLLTISAINVALGGATAGALHFLGFEDALLWGSVAGLLNYAPYVGAVITAVLLLVVGFAQFAEPLHALSAAGAFVALNLLEGQLVTPLLLGRRLSLDPVVIFLAIMLFGFLWGMTGMLIAVPLLACLRIVAQRMPNGAVVAQLIGDSSRAEAEPPEPPPLQSA